MAYSGLQEHYEAQRKEWHILMKAHQATAVSDFLN